MTRIPALDGLRAVAFAMVAAYHVDKSVLPAGYWGVPLFLVLSGFLMTRLLCTELDESGRIDLSSFYTRRLLRLLPPIVAVCLVLLATGTAWPAVEATLGFYANYARIEGLDLGLLTHTWFTSVIGHFYVVWPLVLVAVPREQRLRVVGGLAVLAITWRVIAIELMSPGWVYNATDTNAAALLTGCLLGLGPLRGWRHVGWAIPALVGLATLSAFGERGSAFPWGGFLAIGLSVVVMQHAATRPRWLEAPAVVWLGTISYGLYLWHYVFLRSGLTAWLALPLTVTTAAASWYLVEKPLRRLGMRLVERGRKPDSANTVDSGAPADRDRSAR